MTANLFTLNSPKTEFLLIGFSKQLAKVNNSSLTTTHSARNLDFAKKAVKMADGSVHVLNDLLCFVSCKYGRLPTKQLKSVLIDFYNEETISKAKVCLLNDIMKIDSSVKQPHVPQRREGDNRLTREVDDIVTLFCFVDENRLTSSLPRYVSAGPDNMPSSRIYEGDLRSIMTVMEKWAVRLMSSGQHWQPFQVLFTLCNGPAETRVHALPSQP